MTDGPAFFRAIEADPDDDTPRLVFADWLDEQGGAANAARAEFIRVQCEEYREPNSARSQSLHERAYHLLSAHGSAWAAGWPLKLHNPTYTRGFLDPVHVGPMFPRCAEHLAEVMPLYHLRLLKARVVMKAVAACPQLALVRRLNLSSNVLRNPDMIALTVSPHLGELQHLDLTSNQIGVRGATDLAAARLPTLRSLRIEANPIKDRGLLALALADWPALEHLDAMQCGLRRTGVVGLAESPLVRRLTVLQLTSNRDVPPDGWLALARAPLERMTRLDLSNPTVTDEVVEALAANPALAHLRILHMGGAPLTDRAARAVLDSPHLRGLTRLRLSDQRLSDALRNQLRAAFGEGYNPRW
jgi:uncharacterized protein (TIGR02996 family)